MEAAIDCLERSLDGKVDYAKAAAAANCSTFHFMRMFEVVAGVGPAEYVRRRRLSRAALDLSAGKATVTEAAFAAGYETVESFSRAFRREFGTAPSRAKLPGAALRAWPRLGFFVALKGDVPMEFRIEKLGPWKMVGLPRKVNTEGGAQLKAIPAFWSEACASGAMAALERAMPAASKKGVMGVCGTDVDEDAKTFTYYIAIEEPVTEAGRKALPPGVAEIACPAATWAVFPARGPCPAGIQAAWKRIFSEWFPASGYEHADGPELEVYSLGDPDADDYYSEIWIPVLKP